jgi:hypothetical protein
MPTIGLNENMATVMNPLPDIPEKAIIEQTGIIRRPNGEFGFDLEYQWSVGAEKEFLRMKPGESRILPLSVARSIHKALRHRGFAYVYTGEDPQVKALEALEEAWAFYMNRGPEQLRGVMARHGYKPEDLPEIKRKFAPYLLNETRAKLIRAHIEKLTRDAERQRHAAAQSQGENLENVLRERDPLAALA